MRFSLLFLILLIILPISCKRSSNGTNAEECAPIDSIWVIDSVYIHKMGVSYVEGDSSQDNIILFEYDAYGRTARSFDITDSVIVRETYDYSFLPDSIIKHIEFMFEGEQFSEGYVSVYEMDELCRIKTLTQHAYGVDIVTEYKYDELNDNLSFIHFGATDTSCKWLWRNGNIDKIVYDNGEIIKNYRCLTDAPMVPYNQCFSRLPHLDYSLFNKGFFGSIPKHAIGLCVEETGNEYTDREEIHYEAGDIDLAVTQMHYLWFDYDSLRYSIHWDKIAVLQ